MLKFLNIMSTSDVVKKETVENSNQIENKETVENSEIESVSQILKNNTHEITKKLESQLPLKNATVLWTIYSIFTQYEQHFWFMHYMWKRIVWKIWCG